MGEYTFTEHELDELREVFFSEAVEILQSLNQEVLNLEAGHDRSGSLKKIQRSLHTLKGNARALGFSCLNTLSHKSEDLLKIIRDSSLEADQKVIDLLFTINDTLQAYVDGYRSHSQVTLDERLVERIEEYLFAPGNAGEDKQRPSATDSEPGACLYDILITFDPRCTMKSAGVNMIVERLSMFGEVLGMEPTMESGMLERAEQFTIRFGSSDESAPAREVIDIRGVVKDVEMKKHEAAELGQPREEHKGVSLKDASAQTLRVDALRVDKILNLVGELVIGRSVVGQALSEIGEQYRKDDLFKRLFDANAFMEKTISQLQKNVMKIRMLPISQVFRKFPRVVRDLSLEKEKRVELEMQGEKTELDKSLLDVIGEPLIHLVRNAVDHGIESPDERERTGKARAGTITLSASHEGNQIVIEVKDDGAGLDPQRLREKAVEKGVKTREEAGRLSDDEALDLIFLSGFSTAERVTDISGRGFGMDIVRTTVESLKGRIQIRSKPGEGTVFTLRLPLTLAIIRAMLFKVGDRLFALPMSSIEKILRVRSGDIQTVSGRNVLRFRDKVISLISLRESLMIPNAAGEPNFRKFVIVAGLADKFYGFGVDRLVGQQELVIKVLDNHWGSVNYTAGASILGDGSVVLILDAPSLVAVEIGRELSRV